jgi:hypothetical protein
MTGAATAKNHTEDNNNGDRSWKHDLKERIEKCQSQEPGCVEKGTDGCPHCPEAALIFGVERYLDDCVVLKDVVFGHDSRRYELGMRVKRRKHARKVGSIWRLT